MKRAVLSLGVVVATLVTCAPAGAAFVADAPIAGSGEAVIPIEGMGSDAEPLSFAQSPAFAEPVAGPPWRGDIYQFGDLDRIADVGTPVVAASMLPAEPTPWMLMAGGLILTGGAMRRRRGAGGSATGTMVVA